MRVSEKLRQAYDQEFMTLLATVRADILAAKAPPFAAGSPVAAMFFQESQKSGLQNLAELTAAWNEATLDEAAVDRCLRTLEDLGLDDARRHMTRLKELRGE